MSTEGEISAQEPEESTSNLRRRKLVKCAQQKLEKGNKKPIYIILLLYFGIINYFSIYHLTAL